MFNAFNLVLGAPNFSFEDGLCFTQMVGICKEQFPRGYILGGFLYLMAIQVGHMGSYEWANLENL